MMNQRIKAKKEFRGEINSILSNYQLNYVFNFKISQTVIDIIDIEELFNVIVIGVGEYGDSKWKESPLYKIKFKKVKKNWTFSIKKSLLLKEIETISKENKIKNKNVLNLIDDVLDHLNK